MADPTEVDITALFGKDASHESYDRFMMAVTPKLYEWLRWVLTLAALTYVQKMTDSGALRVLVTVTYALTFGYFTSYFFQFKFVGLPFLRRPHRVRMVSIILSGLLGLGTWYLVTEAVNAVVVAR